MSNKPLHESTTVTITKLSDTKGIYATIDNLPQELKHPHEITDVLFSGALKSSIYQEEEHHKYYFDEHLQENSLELTYYSIPKDAKILILQSRMNQDKEQFRINANLLVKYKGENISQGSFVFHYAYQDESKLF